MNDSKDGGWNPSSVHFSGNGVHADLKTPYGKDHVPYVGQTTLPTFNIGGSPGPENDARLSNLGGSLIPPPLGLPRGK